MTSDNSLANLQNRNVPIQSELIVPKEELVHRPIFIEAHLKKERFLQFKGMEHVEEVSVFQMLLGNFAALRLRHMYTEGLL